jgi:hypothetical protein
MGGSEARRRKKQAGAQPAHQEEGAASEGAEDAASVPAPGSAPAPAPAPEPEPEPSMFEAFGLFVSALRRPENTDTVRWLIALTAVMVLLPLGLFFLGNSVAFSHLAPRERLMYSGFAAVAAVNVVGVAFAAVAFRQRAV